MKLLRPTLLVLVAVSLIAGIETIASPAAAAPRAIPAPKPRKPVPEFVRGEVIEIACYLQDSRNRGDEHSACAQEGILAGGPVGILTSDGTLYLVLGRSSKPANDMLAQYAGRKVKVTGKKVRRAKMLAIVCEKVEELPAEKPKARTSTRK
ncbi:MAG: hypothetical protein AAB152_08210 [Candidatus Coatesbacteria bacterium]